MSISNEKKLDNFVKYVRENMKGYEKGEAQLFLERLFQSFGHEGLLEAGAGLEKQIKINSKTKFCDLLWPKRVLFEMKSKDEKLENHFSQAKAYWDELYSEKTEFVVLCNFDEFWIYKWDYQRDPVSIFKLEDLPKTWRALAFLDPKKPLRTIFNNDLVAVTTEAAQEIAELYNSLLNRGIAHQKAQYFTLQCLVALFAEDSDLFPHSGFFYDLIGDCKNGQSSYDLFPLLFKQMNSKEQAKAGKFKNVKYFNGGIFQKIFPIELNINELNILTEASKYDWSKVQPSIFGNIFESSLEAGERHATGAHYTPEIDIMKIIEPTIIKPWRKKINNAKTLKELIVLQNELSNFKVLDPACGSGNFLYIAFRELVQIEIDILNKIINDFKSVDKNRLFTNIKGSQFYGIDINPFAVELAKITISFAKISATREFNRFSKQLQLTGWIDTTDVEDPLPFENLDKNFIVDDALKVEWPKVKAIIGNPPFQSKNKIQEELGVVYVDEIRSIFPDVSGFADYCVYWFRKAHEHIPENCRVGLVGTNTISQTNSRKGGLDYITTNEGIITDAIKTMPWKGKAVVYVSIVNWIKTKNKLKDKKRLRILLGDKDATWEEFELETIPSSLSHLCDIKDCKKLKANKNPKTCYQGQTHGHEGFLLNPQEKNKLLKEEKESNEVTFPYLIADELLGNLDSLPTKFVIDFYPLELYQAQKYKKTFEIIKDKVLPTRDANYKKEKIKNEKLLEKNPKARVNKHHENFYRKWWQLSYPRGDLLKELKKIRRYIVVSQVSKRSIFEFVSTKIHPNAALVVFPFEDDFSFGILQSSLHWEWARERCSTLKDDLRYTSTTIYDTFPWPQWGILELKKCEKINLEIVKKLALNVAKKGREFRIIRSKIKTENNWSLRDVHKSMELPGDHPLKKALEDLDKAVWEAYSFGLPLKMQIKDTLEFLLQLNLKCAEQETNGHEIFMPGLPTILKNESDFYSDDAIDFSK